MATEIPARFGSHVFLSKNQHLRLTNPSGHQVIDLWAFSHQDNTPSWLSTAQTRSKLGCSYIKKGDTFLDTRRRSILTLVEDTSPGVHDIIFPPCDFFRYTELGDPGHASCGDNLRKELAHVASFERASQTGGELSPLVQLEEKIREWEFTPEPFNIFMNVRIDPEDGGISVKKPVCKPGDYVVLRAETECLIVMSACPNDVAETNARDPGHALYEVLV